MFGKKGRARRNSRRDQRRANRAGRKEARRDARLERIQTRQDARSGRVQMRQETKQSAYEAGIDPNAHWGDTASGIGSGVGDILSGVAGIKSAGAKNTMLPTPSDVVADATPLDENDEKKPTDSSVLPLALGALGLMMFS